MVLALKDTDSVWLAASVKDTCCGVNMEDNILEDNLKMWRPLGKTGVIMATSGISPAADLLRYCDLAELDGPLTHATLFHRILPTIKERLKERDLLNGERLWDELILAKEDKAFVVTWNFTLLEVEDIASIGSSRGEDIVYGAARLFCDLPPVERLAEIFRTTARGCKAVHFPIVIMNTKTDERIVINQ